MHVEEYQKRVEEQKRLIDAYNENSGILLREHISETAQIKEDVKADNDVVLRKIAFVEGRYDVDNYLTTIKGLEDCPEGGSRCGR